LKFAAKAWAFWPSAIINFFKYNAPMYNDSQFFIQLHKIYQQIVYSFVLVK
jgi:hypothetical protein